jgi:hypothetical protein
MMTTNVRRTGRAPVWIALGLLMLALGTAAGPASSAIVIPSELPNRTDQGEFHFRWALVREPARVRAVGLADTPNRVVAWARVGLFGVDRNGRVVSRGDSEIPGSFGQTTLPFEVSLRPTGREDRFDLVLLYANEGKPGD